MNIDAAADRIERAAREAGHIVTRQAASTGSIYLSIDGHTVRVSDHADLYVATRPHHRIDVNPDTGVTVGEAIAMIRAGIDAWPIVQAAEQTPEQVAAARRAAQIRRNAADQAAAIRAELTDDDMAEFRAAGGNRPAARKIAEKHGWSVAYTWQALTGKKWQRNAR